MAKKGSFEYKGTCKLPSCRKPFETNRKWQEFHHPDCQKKWQKLLRRSHEEVVVDIALLKEKTQKLIKAIELSTISVKDLEGNVKKIIKRLGMKK